MNLLNTNFKLYFIEHNDKETRYIPFSIYNNNQQNPFGSYNEKLAEKENSQFSLSFDMSLIYNNTKNIFIEYLSIDRELRLEFDTGEIIDFIITGITPKFGTKNISYSYTCQDSFSFYASKQKNDISLSTDNAEDWDDGLVGPRDITELTEKILSLSSLKNWKLDPSLNNTIIHFPDNLYTYQQKMRVSLELNNTTPYNAFVEVAKLFNATIFLDFKERIIYFKNKETIQYSGLELRPNVNLSKFSYGEKGDNLYNIMHVTGGEDAYGSYISIIPAMPSIIAAILTQTAEEIDFVPVVDDEASYYLAPYCIYYNGYVYVRKKNDISTSYGNYTNIGTSSKWQDCSTILELQNYINNIIFHLDVDEVSGKDLESIQAFFDELSFVPHAQSFLVDFSYWKDVGLLTETRYEAINTFLQKDYRNTNLLLMAYNSQYIKLNYKLQSLINKEEELVAAMAAEDESRATLDENSTITAHSFYISHSIQATSGNDHTSHYLPIGLWNNEIISYGKGAGLQSACYSLPDLDNIIYSLRSLYVLDETNNKVISSVDIEGHNTLLNEIYVNRTNTNQLVYIDIEDLKKLDTDNLNATNNLDYWIDLEIFNYRAQINNLHNTEYFYLQKVVNGSDWLNDKIVAIEEKITEYTEKKNQLITTIESKFGPNWELLDAKTLAFNEMYDELGALKEELKSIQMQIGGKGTREKDGEKSFYLYKGFLTYYLEILKSLDYKTGVFTATNLKEKVSFYKKEQLSKLDSFYNNYSDVIRETKYSDTNQLNSRSLYLAAFKQFATYKKPTKSYSSSFISSNDLLNTVNNIVIGDIVHIIHPCLNTKVSRNSYDIYLSENVKESVDFISVLTTRYNEVKEENEYLAYTEKVLLQDYCFIQSEKGADYDIEDVVAIIVGNKMYDYENANRILRIENTREIKPIELRISGISKSLRSYEAQLTVEENTLYNSLVDRLIAILK